jgi:hypothetical protein
MLLFSLNTAVQIFSIYRHIFKNRRNSPPFTLVDILTSYVFKSIISSHLLLGQPSGLCPSDSRTKKLYASHLPLFPRHQIRFDQSNSIMWGLQMMKICLFLRPVTPSFSDLNILLIIVFSQTERSPRSWLSHWTA